jgi:hypothetical protein
MDERGSFNVRTELMNLAAALDTPAHDDARGVFQLALHEGREAA